MGCLVPQAWLYPNLCAFGAAEVLRDTQQQIAHITVSQRPLEQQVAGHCQSAIIQQFLKHVIMVFLEDLLSI